MRVGEEGVVEGGGEGDGEDVCGDVFEGEVSGRGGFGRRAVRRKASMGAMGMRRESSTRVAIVMASAASGLWAKFGE